MWHRTYSKSAVRHFSYNDIANTVRPIRPDADGYRYAYVNLREYETCDNPASTKHYVSGPVKLLWIIHPMGITLRELDDKEAAEVNARGDIPTVTK